MKVLLLLKHWQIFSLVVGIQIVYKIALLVVTGNNPNAILLFIRYGWLIIVPSAFVFLLWLLSIGVGLQHESPTASQKNCLLFKLSISFIILYLLALAIYNMIVGEFPDSKILILIHICALLSMIYCLFFTAKTLRRVELGRTVQFQDYLSDVLLLWLFPVGIWLIQPRVNKLA